MEVDHKKIADFIKVATMSAMTAGLTYAEGAAAFTAAASMMALIDKQPNVTDEIAAQIAMEIVEEVLKGKAEAAEDKK